MMRTLLLPSSKSGHELERIRQDTLLVVWDYEERLLHGVYQKAGEVTQAGGWVAARCVVLCGAAVGAVGAYCCCVVCFKALVAARAKGRSWCCTSVLLHWHATSCSWDTAAPADCGCLLVPRLAACAYGIPMQPDTGLPTCPATNTLHELSQGPLTPHPSSCPALQRPPPARHLPPALQSAQRGAGGGRGGQADAQGQRGALQAVPHQPGAQAVRAAVEGVHREGGQAGLR